MRGIVGKMDFPLMHLHDLPYYLQAQPVIGIIRFLTGAWYCMAAVQGL